MAEAVKRLIIPGHSLRAERGQCECGYNLVNEKSPPWHYTRWAMRDTHRFHKLDVWMANRLALQALDYAA